LRLSMVTERVEPMLKVWVGQRNRQCGDTICCETLLEIELIKILEDTYTKQPPTRIPFLPWWMRYKHFTRWPLQLKRQGCLWSPQPFSL